MNVDTLMNPTVLMEVLSDSTESYDRGAKFGHYRKIPSVIEYLLVAQHEYRIEQYVRQPAGPWLRSEVQGLGAKIELPSIDCSLELTEVYERVENRGQ
jgi:Uma2 family endonuclease